MALLSSTQRAIAQATNGATAAWTGTPCNTFFIRASDIPTLVFGTIFICFGLFIVSGSWTAPHKGNEPFIFVPFMTVWFAIIISQTILPMVIASLARSRTYYALTPDGNAVIVTNLFGTRVKRIFLPALSNIELTLRGDGSGTITFGPLPAAWSWFTYRSWGGPPQAPAFERIADAAHVYQLCSQLQRNGGSTQ